MALTKDQMEKFVELCNNGGTFGSYRETMEQNAQKLGFYMKDLGEPAVEANFVVWSFVNIEGKQSFLIEDMYRKLRIA